MDEIRVQHRSSYFNSEFSGQIEINLRNKSPKRSSAYNTQTSSLHKNLQAVISALKYFITHSMNRGKRNSDSTEQSTTTNKRTKKNEPSTPPRKGRAQHSSNTPSKSKAKSDGLIDFKEEMGEVSDNRYFHPSIMPLFEDIQVKFESYRKLICRIPPFGIHRGPLDPIDWDLPAHCRCLAKLL